MENLPLQELDTSPDATFKWWLWMSNLGHHTRTIIGVGVVGAELTASNAGEKKIVFRRVDSSRVETVFSLCKIIKIIKQ